MKIGNAHKYQNPALQEKLLATGNRHLAECVPRDRFGVLVLARPRQSLTTVIILARTSWGTFWKRFVSISKIRLSMTRLASRFLEDRV